MNEEILKKAIDRTNSRYEADAQSAAECIIAQIAKLQNSIADSNATIANLREDLKKLAIKQIDAATILGS